MNLLHSIFRGRLCMRMSQTLKRSCLGGKSQKKRRKYSIRFLGACPSCVGVNGGVHAGPTQTALTKVPQSFSELFNYVPDRKQTTTLFKLQYKNSNYRHHCTCNLNATFTAVWNYRGMEMAQSHRKLTQQQHCTSSTCFAFISATFRSQHERGEGSWRGLLGKQNYSLVLTSCRKYFFFP